MGSAIVSLCRPSRRMNSLSSEIGVTSIGQTEFSERNPAAANSNLLASTGQGRIGLMLGSNQGDIDGMVTFTMDSRTRSRSRGTSA